MRRVHDLELKRLQNMRQAAREEKIKKFNIPQRFMTADEIYEKKMIAKWTTKEARISRWFLRLLGRTVGQSWALAVFFCFFDNEK